MGMLVVASGGVQCLCVRRPDTRSPCEVLHRSTDHLSTTVYVWFSRPSVPKGPWHPARLFSSVKYWNEQTSAWGIGFASLAVETGWIRRRGTGDLGGFSWFAFSYAFTTPKRWSLGPGVAFLGSLCCKNGRKLLPVYMVNLARCGLLRLCASEWRVDISLLALAFSLLMYVDGLIDSLKNQKKSCSTLRASGLVNT